MSTATLSALTEEEVAAADHRSPKWATMCQLRRIGLPTLDAVLVTPRQDHLALDGAIATLANATRHDRLMIRSDGGAETHRYYRGGNTFPLADVATKAAMLLEAGRAVILMEPTNRFTNCPDTGHLSGVSTTTDDQAAEAEAWLREHGYDQLWRDDDVALAVTRRIRHWFDDAFMIALCHPRPGWTCLAIGVSDLGDRCVFWDIVDGSRKYSTSRLA
jgi:hypothetical protein